MTKLIQFHNQVNLNKSQKQQLKRCLDRLNEMKVIIEKIRPMEKKMRYQIDKLLTISSSSSTFALGGQEEKSGDNDDDEDSEDDRVKKVNNGEKIVEMEESDPLAFRPNLDDFGNENDDDDDDDDVDSEIGSDEEENADEDDFNCNDSNGSNVSDDIVQESSEDEEDDEEILAAKAALNAGRSSSKKKPSSSSSSKSKITFNSSIDSDDESNNEDLQNFNKVNNNNNNNIYKAPRLAAVPFAEKEKQQVKEERKLQKQRERMRKSELLSTLKATYGDMPEEDDYGGGASIGKQRESARRLAEREMEKEKFEEGAFVRLTTSRKDKKLRKKIMREEVSNLHSIADIGNLTAGVSIAFGDKKGSHSGDFSDDNNGDEIIKVDGSRSSHPGSRHANGKRRRVSESSKSRRRNEPKNAYQRALFGMDGGSGKRKKRQIN